jgi:hypothetical protein
VELQYLFQNGSGQGGRAPAQFGLSLRSVTETFPHAWGPIKGDNVEVGVVLYY